VLYCDGVVQGINTTTGTGMGNAWAALWIGATATATYFTGSICDMRVFSSAFSSQQVQDFRKNSYSFLQSFSSDFGSPVSTQARGGVAGDELESTGWRFGRVTPRYSVVSDATTVIDGRACKAMKCTVAGHIYLATETLKQTPQEAAYGQWELRFYRLAASLVNFFIISSHKEWLDAAANGYFLQILADGSGGFYKKTAGAYPLLFSVGAGFFAPSIWYAIRITRSGAGAFVMTIKGGAYTTWTVVGSATDNAHTASSYMELDIDAGDMVSLGDATGNGSITKSTLP
jgi:hypothetical protein